MIPTHIDRRLLTSSPPMVVDTRIAIAVGDAGVPLVEGQLELCHRKTLRDRHFMQRALVVTSLTWGRTHYETPRGHDDHFGAIAALLEQVRPA